MKKSIFCLILVAVLAASALCVFTACNDNDVDPPIDDNAHVENLNDQMVFATRGNSNLTIRKVANRSDIDHTDTGSTTIVATVGGDATDKTVTWSVAWKDAESEWASGKSIEDYITLDAEDETNTVTVSCLQAFGEQAIITCTADGASDLEATATVDFRKRIIGVEAECAQINLVDGAPTFSSSSSSSHGAAFSASIVYSVGTVENSDTIDNFQITSIDLALSDTLKQGIAGDVANAKTQGLTYNEKITVTGESMVLDNTCHVSGEIGWGNFMYCTGGNSAYVNAARGRVWKNVDTAGWHIIATVHVSVRINGKAQTFDLPLNVKISNIHFTDYTLPDSLNLSKDSIVF